MGRLLFQGLVWFAGIAFIAAAVRALLTGDFTASKRIVYGNPTGVEHILRNKRPAAFWFCLVAFLLFGVILLGLAMFVL